MTRRIKVCLYLLAIPMLSSCFHEHEKDRTFVYSPGKSPGRDFSFVNTSTNRSKVDLEWYYLNKSNEKKYDKNCPINWNMRFMKCIYSEPKKYDKNRRLIFLSMGASSKEIGGPSCKQDACVDYLAQKIILLEKKCQTKNSNYIIKIIKNKNEIGFAAYNSEENICIYLDNSRSNDQNLRNLIERAFKND